MKKKIETTIFATLALLLLAPLYSCVNEWPHPENLQYNVTLTVHSETEWLPEYQLNLTKADDMQVEYIFQIFKDRDFSSPFKEFTMYSSDLTRADFNISLQLWPGDYSVYVWSDFSNPTTKQSLYYLTEDFAAITYKTPYTGNTDYKDAFRGSLNFSIKESMYLNPTSNETIVLQRPLARYIFVANDLEAFLQNEETKGRLRSATGENGDHSLSTRDIEEELSAYSVKIYYPLYMAAVFNNYTDEPYDSWTGISYTGKISPISNSEAALGLDFVMLPTSPSSAQVALEIYNASGERIGGTSTITVPLQRDRTTVITGNFLTSQEDAGVHLNPDFEGQYNIEYR